MTDLSKSNFSEEQVAYVESHSPFTYRNMADFVEWKNSLEYKPPSEEDAWHIHPNELARRKEAGEAKLNRLNTLSLAQQIAVWQLTDEVRNTFFLNGLNSPLTEGIAAIE